MDGNIPSLPEVPDILGIPPITIELPVSKEKQLTHKIHQRVKDQVETQQPEEMVGKLQNRHV